MNGTTSPGGQPRETASLRLPGWGPDRDPPAREARQHARIIVLRRACFRFHAPFLLRGGQRSGRSLDNGIPVAAVIAWHLSAGTRRQLLIACRVTPMAVANGPRPPAALIASVIASSLIQAP
jgi:hypothetical protein